MLSFLRFERAGAEDETPARPHEARRGIEEAGLERDQLVEIHGALGPGDVRVPPQGAGCGARRIEEDGVEAWLYPIVPSQVTG